MCRGWKKGRGNRGQMGVYEHFQPPPSSGTWLWAACLTPLTPHLWIPFWYGGSKYLFIRSWRIRACPSFCVSAVAWEGEGPRGKGEPAFSSHCRSLVGDRCFCSGLVVPTSSLVRDIILICSKTNLLWSIRRVVYLCSDKCYEHNVGFMTTPLDLLIAVKGFFSIHLQIMSLCPSLFLKEKQFIYSPISKEHPQGGEKWHLWVSPNMFLLCFKGYLRLSFDILLKMHEFLSDVRWRLS